MRTTPAALAKVHKAMDFVHQRQADTMRVVKTVLKAREDRPRL